VLRVLFRQFRHRLRTGLWRIPTVSAAVKARHRLGREPLKALFRRLRGTHADPAEPGMSVFGLELALLKVSVDGTSLDVADTAANRAAFGEPPRNGKGANGPFPKIRLLTLIASGTRTIIEAVWGPFATGELTLLSKLVGLGALRPGMLVLADRYFSGHPQVAQVIAAGADLIFRAQNNRRLPVLKELPDGSYLSVLPSANLPTKGDRHRAGGGPCPRLGLRKRQARGLRIRVVEATVTIVAEGGETRTEPYLLITTLLDPAVAPAQKIAELYHERWESETGYADLKTYLRGRQHILRSKTPNGVAQELYALLIVYQLVQITRSQAARVPGLRSAFRDPATRGQGVPVVRSQMFEGSGVQPVKVVSGSGYLSGGTQADTGEELHFGPKGDGPEQWPCRGLQGGGVGPQDSHFLRVGRDRRPDVEKRDCRLHGELRHVGSQRHFPYRALEQAVHVQYVGFLVQCGQVESVQAAQCVSGVLGLHWLMAVLAEGEVQHDRCGEQGGGDAVGVQQCGQPQQRRGQAHWLELVGQFDGQRPRLGDRVPVVVRPCARFGEEFGQPPAAVGQPCAVGGAGQVPVEDVCRGLRQCER
jgi:hypothetical protein